MNPALGVFFHWLGGLASASFYVPYRGVKNWAWETYWLVGGFFSWIIAPWILALTMTHDLMRVLHEAPASSLFWAYVFGVLWGLGGLTFGLTMRYLGMSLGMAVALGYTRRIRHADAADFPRRVRRQSPGHSLGIDDSRRHCRLPHRHRLRGRAGVSKEREMSEEQKRASIKEFDLKKGLLVATFSGVMSACFAYGLAAGDPIKAITIQHGTAAVVAGTAGAGGGAGRRLHHQLHLVPDSQHPQPHRLSVFQFGDSRQGPRTQSKSRSSKTPSTRPPRRWRWPSPSRQGTGGQGSHAVQLPVLRPRRNHLVLPVFLLHHGRNPDGHATSSPVGRCTWPASSSSARCGASR